MYKKSSINPSILFKLHDLLVIIELGNELCFTHCLYLAFHIVPNASVSQFSRPVNRSTSGLPVHHQLLEFTQTHVHQALNKY